MSGTAAHGIVTVACSVCETPLYTVAGSFSSHLCSGCRDRINAFDRGAAVAFGLMGMAHAVYHMDRRRRFREADVYCNRLGCPGASNLRCRRSKGHAGECDAWATEVRTSSAQGNQEKER